MLAPRSDTYLLSLIMVVMDNLRDKWRTCQPCQNTNGTWETPMEAAQCSVERLLAANKRTRKFHRCKEVQKPPSLSQYSPHNHSQWYSHCLATVRYQLAFQCKHPNSTKAWTFLEDLLLCLGQDGMSSEDTPPPSALPQIYQVNLLPWRRDVGPELRIINKKYNNCMPVQDKKGKKHGWDGQGWTRIICECVMVGSIPQSKCGAPSGLPKQLFNEVWFKGMSKGEKRGIMVNKKQFVWLYVVSNLAAA